MLPYMFCVEFTHRQIIIMKILLIINFSHLGRGPYLGRNQDSFVTLLFFVFLIRPKFKNYWAQAQTNHKIVAERKSTVYRYVSLNAFLHSDDLLHSFFYSQFLIFIYFLFFIQEMHFTSFTLFFLIFI